MNQIAKAFILYLCFVSINCEWFKRDQQHHKEGKPVAVVPKTEETVANKTTDEAHARQKRQWINGGNAFAGGFGMGFGAYDYNDYYGDYVSDYAYDYYDWLCTSTSCQLCDILTSECCLPGADINCFLPDSCLNNPCLAGGTCITTRTIDNQPDFTCVCLPGLTGKYCQIYNDYFVGADVIDPILMPAIPPPMPPMPPMGGVAPQAPQGYGYAQQEVEQQQPPMAAAPMQSGYGQQPIMASAPASSGYGQQPIMAAGPAPSGYEQQPQPAMAAGPAPSAYGQQSQNLNDGRFMGQTRTLASKRKNRCESGKIWMADRNECVDFALKK